VERLHAIRFLGNDAVHEIKTAKSESVMLALEIVEHALKSIYVFDNEAERVLELPFRDYNDMKNVLRRRLRKLTAGSHTLERWLDNHARRLCERRSELEEMALADVKAGRFPGISDGGTKSGPNNVNPRPAPSCCS